VEEKFGGMMVVLLIWKISLGEGAIGLVLMDVICARSLYGTMGGNGAAG